MTIQELSQLRRLNKEIERDKQRLAELEAAATSCTQKITGMPHVSGVTDSVGKYAAEIADLKSIIELNIQRCWYELNRLHRFIDTIEDSYLRQIFSLRYISGLTWNQVAASIGGNTEDSVRMAHNRYLKSCSICSVAK